MTLPAHDSLVAETTAILGRLGVRDLPADGDLIARSPITGGELARIRSHTAEDVSAIVGRAHDAFAQWRSVPAPARGALVRELGELLRQHKDDLGALVSIEAGKIRSEGLGEVQEMIDICDLARGRLVGRARWRRGRRGAGGRSARGADQRDRLDTHGPLSGAAGRRTLRP